MTEEASTPILDMAARDPEAYVFMFLIVLACGMWCGVYCLDKLFGLSTSASVAILLLAFAPIAFVYARRFIRAENAKTEKMDKEAAEREKKAAGKKD